TIGRPVWRYYPLVGSPAGDRFELDSAPFQIAGRVAEGPAPDDVSTQGHYLPRFEFWRPGRHFARVLVHILLEPRLIGFNDCSNFRRKLRITVLGNYPVLPYALEIVVLDVFRAEYLGHRTFGATVLFQDLFQSIFRLGIAHSIDCALLSIR